MLAMPVQADNGMQMEVVEAVRSPASPEAPGHPWSSLSLSEAGGCLLLVSPSKPDASMLHTRFSRTLYMYLALALLLLHLIFSTKP